MPLFLLLFITLLALITRLINFSHTTWAYDQARDAFNALEIFGKDPIKLIGPTTDIRGLFHGSLYWYIIAPFYVVSRGDPLFPKLALVLLHLINIPLIYFLAKEITGKKEIGLFAAFILAMSFDSIQYARWMSNPTLAVMTVAMFFYGLWRVLHKKPYGLGIMYCMWAISIQFQFFLVYLGVFMLVGGWRRSIDGWKGRSVGWWRRKVLRSRGNVILFLLGSLFLLPFFISEIKFGFQGTQSLLGFFLGHAQESAPFAQKVDFYINSLVKNVFYSVAGASQGFARTALGTLVIYTLYTAWKYPPTRFAKLFLLMWFLSPVLIYPIQKNGSYFLNIGNSYPLITLFALTIFEITEPVGKKYQNMIIGICALVIAFFNMQLINTYSWEGERLFSVQKAVDLQTEKKVIDWIYADSNGKVFAVNTVTNPLFINTTWAYLFEHYAQPKYGRKPFWAGEPIDARHPGWDIPFNPTGFDPGNTLYLIIEPIPGIPDEYIQAYSLFEDTRSVLVRKIPFGTFIVEKRTIIKPESFSRNAVFELTQKREFID